jgi:hypothetical protein
VSSLKRRLRSLLIALAVLALSAGAVMAGRGAHLSDAAPTGPTAEQGDQNEQGDEAEAPEVEQPEAPETETPETDEPQTGGDTGTAGVHPDNHGKLVSEAAQLTPLPDGFASRGAYVRTVAGANHGHDQSAAAKTKKPKSH